MCIAGRCVYCRSVVSTTPTCSNDTTECWWCAQALCVRPALRTRTPPCVHPGTSAVLAMAASLGRSVRLVRTAFCGHASALSSAYTACMMTVTILFRTRSCLGLSRSIRGAWQWQLQRLPGVSAAPCKLDERTSVPATMSLLFTSHCALSTHLLVPLQPVGLLW